MNMNSNSWNLRQLFGLMDKNQDGVIDVQDLAAICTHPDSLPVDQVKTKYINILQYGKLIYFMISKHY